MCAFVIVIIWKFADISHVECAKRNLSKKTGENEETSVDAKNDNEDSNVGELRPDKLLQVSSRSYTRFTSKHRVTRRNFSRRFSSSEFHPFWYYFGCTINITFLIILNRLTSAKTIGAQEKWEIFVDVFVMMLV